MPIFDRACPTCAWVKADNYEPHGAVVLCPNGHETTKVFIASRVSVIGDEFPGGRTFENLGHDPVTVYSRSELKREMDARGLRHAVRHVGVQGSDKNPGRTDRWI